MAIFPYYIKFAFILVRRKREMKLFINKCESSNRNLMSFLLQLRWFLDLKGCCNNNLEYRLV